jgi:hypothetical protein
MAWFVIPVQHSYLLYPVPTYLIPYTLTLTLTLGPPRKRSRRMADRWIVCWFGQPGRSDPLPFAPSGDR